MSEEKKLQMFHDESGNLMAPIDLLVPGMNFRENKDPDDELTASIGSLGITTSLLVRDGGDERLHIIDGERRYHAAKKHKIVNLPIRLCDGATDIDALLNSLSTQNRRPFTQIELANAFNKLVELGLPVQEIASRLGCSTRTIIEAQRVAKSAIDEIKKSKVPARAKARAATLPAKAQKELVPKLTKAKNAGEAMSVIRQAEKDLKKNTRGVKAAESKPVIKNFRQALDDLERRARAKRRQEPNSLYFKGIEAAVDYFRGIGSLNDLFEGKMNARRK